MTLPDRITKLIADAAWSRDNAAGMTLEREEVEALAGLPDLVEALVAEAVAKERERCAHVAEREGVYPELNIYAGGPEWYRHGKRIVAAIRAGKGE